jgi:hypothetical protein
MGIKKAHEAVQVSVGGGGKAQRGAHRAREGEGAARDGCSLTVEVDEIALIVCNESGLRGIARREPRRPDDVRARREGNGERVRPGAQELGVSSAQECRTDVQRVGVGDVGLSGIQERFADTRSSGIGACGVSRASSSTCQFEWIEISRWSTNRGHARIMLCARVCI